MLMFFGCRGESKETSGKSGGAVIKKVEGSSPAKDRPSKVQAEKMKTRERTKSQPKKRLIAIPRSPAGKSSTRSAYVYRRKGRPDPFRPFFIEATTTEVAKRCEGVPPGPLTEKEVGQFSLVGVVGMRGQYVAMVEDTEGKGYFITLNSYIGKKCGKVTYIGPDKVIVEEPYTDLLGKERIRKVALQLKRSKGGKEK
jgi:Tfp pilus assembly protein PilP